ncbi:hypothetical protein CC99x_004530 [Candidatus Berkiella cookevillensis]|uniref:Uncharacterized protein n=1 Tax=Candidatus Berkiella cookevillensis TaxID=437022 RepID=A0A0Q9YQU5_9GAMM|nr:hypothetical protein [Candidatus Berkiella cookevillensis]MCS5708164.1 hypothetical protein [Candidatus Berkiella cookevillensis]
MTDTKIQNDDSASEAKILESDAKIIVSNAYPKLQNTFVWGKMVADIFEDLFAGLFAFIPNGLDSIYNELLKEIPIVRILFEIRAVEIVIKLISGITIGQGVAQDVAKYLFRPIGFGLGALIGSSLAFLKAKPQYNGSIGEILYRLSGQTVLGALFGLLATAIGFSLVSGLSLNDMNMTVVLMSLGVGACVGLMAKAMLLLSVSMVNRANAANMRRNVKRAKDLSIKLKEAAKQRAKSRILKEAQALISQVNGAQPQELMDAFFNSQFEAMAYHTYKKIDRHFNYLADRACCGDLQALKKLQLLIPARQVNKFKPVKSALEVMIDRIFNERTLFQLRDDVDNSYDRWRYADLKV